MANTPQHLSPRQAARALGASESSLKRWVDAGDLATSRTAGGHRRIPLAEVRRFARSEGLVLRDPVLAGGIAPAVGAQLTAAVTRALLAGEGAEVQGLILRAHLDGIAVAALADGPLRYAMEAVGELWQHGEEGIAREHHATLLVLRAGEALRSVLPVPATDAPVALGGAPAGDPYQLPSLLASLVLQAAGWRTIDLGADVPDGALVAAARHHGAALVWRCFTSDLAAQASVGLASVCHRLAPCRVVAGGRCSALLGDLPGVSNLERPAAMAGLATLARREV